MQTFDITVHRVQESSVEAFGAVHAKVQEGDNKQETTRGASLRELQHFFEKEDSSKRYAGLRRIGDEDGTAVWTILKKEEVATKLEERAKEWQEEERRRDNLFNAQARAPPEAKEAASKEVEARLRAELEAARGEVQVAEAAREVAESSAVCCHLHLVLKHPAFA